MMLVCWHYRELGNPTTVSESKQLLDAIHPDVLFLCETKIRKCEFDRIRRWCNMVGSFAIDMNGRWGGLVVLWNKESNVDIQSFSLNHVDMLIRVEGVDRFSFTRFYGFPKLNLRNQS